MKDAALDPGLREQVDTDGVEAGVTIQVLAREGRQPLPGARVFYLERNQARRQERRNGYAHESEAAERHGTMLIADEEGRVVLPRPRTQLLVAGQIRNLFGSTRVGNGRRRGRRRAEPSDRVEELLLSADQTLEILAIDADGQGRADVPISLYQGAGWGDSRTIWSGRSAEGGRRELRHFQLLRRDDDDNRFAAAVPAPFYDPVVAEFTIDEPKIRVELRLPQHGSLEVALADAAGEILRGKVNVQLAPLRPDGYELDLPLPDDFDELQDNKDRGADSVHFPLVGLGLELSPECRIEDSEAWNAAPFPGPFGHGQHLRVTVSLAKNQAVLAGRVIQANGEPLKRSWVYAEMRGWQDPVDAAAIETDEEGLFEWGVEPDQPDPPYVLDLRLEDRWDTRPEGIRIELPVLQVGKRQDLGDLQLEAPAVLARGQVVDDRGEPVSRVDIRLQHYESRPAEGAEPRWQDDSMIIVGTDEEGRYEMVAEPPGGRLRLEASRRGFLTTVSGDLVPGSLVDLTLVRAARLSGSALVPDWLAAELVQLHLISRQDGEEARTQLRSARGQARFSFAGLTPGTYDLFAVLRGEERAFLRVESLTVGPGDNLRDARLQGVDLTQRVHRYILRFVDRSGGSAPLTGSILGGLEPDSQPFAIQVDGEATRFISSQPALRLVLLAEGLMAQALTLTPGERQVPVHTGVAVDLHVPGAGEATANGPEQVQVGMTFTGETGLPSDLRGLDQRTGRSLQVNAALLRGSVDSDLRAGDTAGFRLPRPGSYRVELRLSSGDRAATVSLGTVLVDPNATSQRFEVVPDPEKIAAAIAGLGR